MVALVACVDEIAGSIGISLIISPSSNSSCENISIDRMRNGTVGDAPIKLDGSEGAAWTRACKYLLTDLKWLIGIDAPHGRT